MLYFPIANERRYNNIEAYKMLKIVSALVVLLAACAASAQTYPTKPIRLVVGFAPGGAADIISRAMSDPLTRALGQGIIVDNKPGAGSSLAAELVT